ncbi:MAG: 50S ribosomal protein L22 [Chitinophagaceae bacterium]|nr:50S ribosomal protein L22 [Chitinophagaceae bacterium]
MAEARAILRNCPSSPRKMRYVADMIRGMDAEKALFVLQHSAKYGAKPMEKLLRSAIDNWEKKNEGIRIEDAQLIVKTLFVDGGAMLKRWLPAPHGRAYKKRKRSNHVTLVVDSKPAVVETPGKFKKKATENKVEPTVEAPAKKARSKKAPKETVTA